MSPQSQILSVRIQCGRGAGQPDDIIMFVTSGRAQQREHSFICFLRIETFSASCDLTVCGGRLYSASSYLWPQEKLPHSERRYLCSTCMFLCRSYRWRSAQHGNICTQYIFRPPWVTSCSLPHSLADIPAQCAMRCCNPPSCCFTSSTPRCCTCADLAQRAGLQAALVTFRPSPRCRL